MSKLILIDGNAILHRAFHALPVLTTKRGEPVNAVYGLITMLLRAIQDLKPSHIAICFDEKGVTFRHKICPTYQAQRPTIANELSSQFAKAKTVIEAFGIPVYSKRGFEADDIIGTLAKKAKQEVIIITGDRDMLQLVNSKIKVYLPVVGLSSAKLMGEKEVMEKMGIYPSQIPEYKALVGDPSDNYPGVAGIGPKTAANLLNRYKSLGGIYKNLSKIPPSVREKLVKGKSSAYLSLKLARIVTNVPLRGDLAASGKWKLVNNEKLLRVFTELGFKSLLDRVKKMARQADLDKQETLF